MSNYAKFMVCWSSIDRLVPDTAIRASQIIERYTSSQYGKVPFIVSGGATDKRVVNSTMACEVVVVGSANGFAADDMLSVLASMQWEFPNEVELFYKSEEMDRYEVRHLEDVGDGKGHGIPEGGCLDREA